MKEYLRSLKIKELKKSIGLRNILRKLFTIKNIINIFYIFSNFPLKLYNLFIKFIKFRTLINFTQK